MDVREARQGGGGRHPWESARVSALRRIACCHGLPGRLGTAPAVLDIGCGDGFTVAGLCRGWGARIDGVDINLTPEEAAALGDPAAGLRVHAAYETLGTGGYDLITMFDVLEHVAEDGAFLKELAGRYGRSAGLVFLTVPAFDCLFSRHDRFLEHHRRYSLAQLRAVVGECGLAVRGQGYLFASLLPMRAVSVALERAGLASAPARGVGGWRHGPLLTRALCRLLEWDNRLLLTLNRAGLRPPGLTAWVLCEIR